MSERCASSRVRPSSISPGDSCTTVSHAAQAAGRHAQGAGVILHRFARAEALLDPLAEARNEESVGRSGTVGVRVRVHEAKQVDQEGEQPRLGGRFVTGTGPGELLHEEAETVREPGLHACGQDERSCEQ